MSLLDEINAAIDELPEPETKGATGEESTAAAETKKSKKYSPEFEEFAGNEET